MLLLDSFYTQGTALRVPTDQEGGLHKAFFSHGPLIWELPSAWGWERRWQPSWACSRSSSNPRPRRQLGGASSQLPLMRPLIYSSRNSGCASLSAPLEREGFCHFSFLCDSSLSLPASQSPGPHTLGPRGMGDTVPWMKPVRELLPTACLGVAWLCSHSVSKNVGLSCRAAGRHFLWQDLPTYSPPQRLKFHHYSGLLVW